MINLQEQFYNFNSDPFRLGSDHHFSYAHNSYENALAFLKFALESEEGFIVITGRPGTGKTTLINELVSQLDSNKVEVATLVTTQYEAEDLLHMVAAAFGLNTALCPKSDTALAIEEFLRKKFSDGKRVLLIVDEAQGLKRDAVEELRLLSNLQEDGKTLLQTFLVGQEEFRKLIESPDLEQLRQRVVAATRLESLSEKETINYIAHRLSCAGWSGDPKITTGVALLVHHFSGGVPRVINLVCRRLMFHGCMNGKHELNALDMKRVLEESSDELIILDGKLDFSEAIPGLTEAEKEYIHPLPVKLAPVKDKQSNKRKSARVISLETMRTQSATSKHYAEGVVSALLGRTKKGEKKPGLTTQTEQHEKNAQLSSWPKSSTTELPAKKVAHQQESRDSDSSFLGLILDNIKNNLESYYKNFKFKKEHAWSVAVGVCVAGLIVMVLSVEKKRVQVGPEAETSRLSINVEVEPEEAISPSDIKTLPAKDTIQARIKEHQNAISVIKSLDFNERENTDNFNIAENDNKKQTDSFRVSENENIAVQETGIPQLFNPVEDLSEAKKILSEKISLAIPEAQVNGEDIPASNSEVNFNSVESGSVAVRESLQSIPKIGDVASESVLATIVNRNAKNEENVTLPGLPGDMSLQGVEGFGPDLQREHLFKGKWKADQGQVNFLPSEKVYCKEFARYISCWKVPEYAESSRGTYKRVVESRISGFTNKGAFTVTTYNRDIDVDADGNPKYPLVNGLPAETTTTITKQCVFIDQNYISCSADQGKVERYSLN